MADDNFWVFKDGPKTIYKLKSGQSFKILASTAPNFYNYGFPYWGKEVWKQPGLPDSQLLWSGTITIPAPKFHAQIVNFVCSTREEVEAHNLKLALDSVDPNVEGDW